MNLDMILLPSWPESVASNKEALLLLNQLSASIGLQRFWNDHPETDVIFWDNEAIPLSSIENYPMVCGCPCPKYKGGC
jgi:hypothetical protein